MTQPDFRQQVFSYLRFYEQPDYTAKGDSVVWFKHNAAQARPILMELAENGDKTAKAMLDVIRQQLGY